MEITERSHGVGSEDPIDATAVKAEARQASLEVDDVVPAEIRRGQLQEALPKAPASFHQCRPGRCVAFAGLGEMSRALKLGDSSGSRLAEVTELHVRDGQTEGGESTLEVADRLARGPGGQWELLRNSSNSWSRALLLLAPTIRRRTSPPENSNIVGMLIT